MSLLEDEGYKIGDRVKHREDGGMMELRGRGGTIVEMKTGKFTYIVLWDGGWGRRFYPNTDHFSRLEEEK